MILQCDFTLWFYTELIYPNLFYTVPFQLDFRQGDFTPGEFGFSFHGDCETQCAHRACPSECTDCQIGSDFQYRGDCRTEKQWEGWWYLTARFLEELVGEGDDFLGWVESCSGRWSASKLSASAGCRGSSWRSGISLLNSPLADLDISHNSPKKWKTWNRRSESHALLLQPNMLGRRSDVGEARANGLLPWMTSRWLQLQFLGEVQLSS